MSIEQGSLAGMQPAADFNPSRRNAFARVPFTQYWGVDPAKFNEVTDADEELIEPEVIRNSLYRDQAEYSISGVLFTPSEYAVVPLSVRAFAARVAARALGAHSPLEGEREDEVSVDKRAVRHAFESHIPKLDNFIAGYTETVGDMRWLKKEIPYHWQAHTNEADMRIRTNSARMRFEEVIDSVAASDKWSDDKLASARLAHEKKLLMGTLVDKKAHWMGYVALSGNLALGKRAIVKNKVSEMGRYIKRATV